MSKTISEIVQTDLPLNLPLWKVSLVHFGEDILEPDTPTQSYIVFRIHHCIAGIVSLQMFTIEDGVSLARLLFHCLDEHWKGEVVDKRQALRRVTQGGIKGFINYFTSFGRLITMKKDNKEFKKPLSPSKNIAWTKSFNLSDIKQIAQNTSTTVNSVVTTLIYCAFWHYCNDTVGLDPTKIDVTAAIPYSTKGLHGPVEFGNSLSTLFLKVALSSDLKKTLEIVHQEVER